MERHSRLVMLVKVENACTEAVCAGFARKFGRLPEVMRKTMTYDRGKEMEKDIEGHSHWLDLTQGQYIQGLVAREGSEQRVYVVTITPEMSDTVHERWPRVVSG